MATKRLWTETYRPKSLEGYIFQNNNQREQIQNLIKSGDIPHLLLSGTQGSGKTTLSGILINELGILEEDILQVNTSRHTGVDFIRDIVIPFTESFPMGKIKIVQLEEADYLSINAQGMLRDVLERNSDTCRFVLTCNYEHKIIPPLKSRCQQLRFKTPSHDDVITRMFELLIAENVDFDPELVDVYVSQAYPDIRKVINNLQLNTIDNKLGTPTVDSEGGDYQFKLLDLLAVGNLREIRKLVTEQCTAEQLTEVYEFLYRNLSKIPKAAANLEIYEQCLVVLADGIYKHGLSAIPHLNFEATVVKLTNSIGE